ncbi:C4-dicarboxylate ABC transporter [Lentibacillus kapialis]|uniref:C4-dicarboxylate ABC transporter n=1 Tax=Lentibacillus kapialis TaxID=340214 RepID=A0A917UYX5_9BACI|nr:TRAP transporter fused permease subunit [Lentibacillus kapialis]GGJ98453.1 C4-dicarboxylate ABC transporter [Lentibacillus kapialis]
MESQNVNQDSLEKTWQSKILKYIGVISAVILSIFHLYTAYSGIFITAIVHYSIHLLLVAVIFLTITKPLSKVNKHLIWLDLLFLTLAAYSIGYVIFNYYEILSIMGPTTMSLEQKLSATVILLLVLYAAFRINKAFFILSILMLLYGLFGNNLGGPFQHAGMSIERLVYLISYTTDGVFGVALGISATYLFIFIFFGVVLEKTGTGDFILKASQALVGKYVGGSAKTSVIASAGMGSVVGSSVGNVVSTGSLTIPVMKKSGFRPHIAGAVESVASEGGQILPPILGAGAFIMATMTGIPYVDIVVAATIPALLYFISVLTVVDFESRKFNIKGLTKDRLPDFKKAFKEKGHLLISVGILVYLLLFDGMGIMKAGFFAIISLLLLAMLREETRLKFTDFIRILIDGAIGAIEIAIICATMGIITGVVVFSGIGARLSEIIIGLSGGDIFLTLIAAMVVSIILGMGLPTPVAYLMSALFVAPALVDIGVPVLAAHLFLFYFAVKSGTTPPIAIVAVVASNIAKANWFKTAIAASLFSLPSFVIAYAFVFQPALLFEGSWSNILLTFMTALIAVIGITGGIQGWWLRKSNWIERGGLIVFSICTIFPNTILTIIGVLGIIVITFYQYMGLKNTAFKGYENTI